jgi:hypothetical protein
VDAKGITFSGRQATSIVEQHFPRATIADLCVERMRIQNQAIRHLGISIIKPDGQKIVILRRPRAELDFVCQAMRTALELGDDPLGKSQYPRLPRFSRIKHRLTADGVALTLFPSRLGWDGVMLAAACCAGVLAVDYYILQKQPGLGDAETLSLWGMLRAGALAACVTALALLARYRFRRAITLAWTANTLHLNERSLFTPCAISWSGDRIDSIRIETSAKARRSSLVLRLRDETDVMLIKDQASRTVGLAEAMLKTAMCRSKPVPANPEQRQLTA